MKQRKKLAVSGKRKKNTLGSKKGFVDFSTARATEADNDLIAANWTVKYDPIGHVMIVEAKVKIVNSKDSLLQVWLGDHAPGIWIPEDQPRISSVIEFAPEDMIKSAHVGLFDAKWRPEDRNVEYVFVLSGYVQHGAGVEKFQFEKKMIYPG